MSKEAHFQIVLIQIPPKHIFFIIQDTYKGIPITFDIRNSSEYDKANSYSEPRSYERIKIAVDDNGVADIRWQGQFSVDNIVEENIEIISLEDIIDIAVDRFSYEYALYDKQQEPEDFSNSESKNGEAAPAVEVELGNLVNNEIYIEKITLGFMQIPTMNGNDQRALIPVWDFFGYIQKIYDTGAEKIYYEKNKSLLTINAMNGSIIDREIGY